MFLPGLPEIMELEESRLMAQLRVELGYGRMHVQQCNRASLSVLDVHSALIQVDCDTSPFLDLW